MSFLNQNKDILISLFPDFEKDIFKKHKAEDSIEHIISKSGDPVCIYKNKLVHSKHNPVIEAEKLLNIDSDTNIGLFVFMGFGMGYHIEAFLKHFPDTPFLIIEPDISFFIKVLEFRSYKNILNNKKLTLMLNPSVNTVSALISKIDKSNIRIIKLRSIYEYNSEYYDDIENKIQQFISRKQINFNTINRFGKLWINNLVRNLPVLNKSNGIVQLKDTCKNLPALLIAGGPSINNIAKNLEELKKRFVIICVDTSYKFCIDNAISPDFTVIVDPQYWNTRHLDFTETSDTILISESSTHPRIFNIFKENIFFCSSLFPLGQYFEKNTKISGKLGAGGSVSTSAWDFAKYIGCSEIFCAGLDLGFPNNETHFKGSFFENLASITSNRTTTEEQKNYMAINNAKPFPIENNSGKKTLTDQRLVIYKNWFEGQIEDSEIKSYNLSQFGIKIEGMEYYDYKKLFNYPEIRDKIKLDINNNKKTIKNPEALLSAVKNLINDFNIIMDLSKNAVILLNDIKEAIKNNLEYSEKLNQLNNIDRKILSSSSKDIAGFIIYPIFSKIINTNTVSHNTEEILNNSETIYKELVKASQYHINILNKSELLMKNRS